MAFPVASRKADAQTPPRAYQASGPQGQAVAVSVSGSADYINLSKGFDQAPYDRSRQDKPTSPTENYVAIECDVDLGIIVGATAALVSSGNAPSLAAVGSVTGGVYSGAAGVCFVLYAKTAIKFLMQPGVDLFLGYVAAGAGTMRLYQCSPDNA